MSQSLTKLTTFSVMALALAACGGDKIDATNAATLKSSLQSIAELMTEAERQSFGQDILLVVERDKADSDDLGIEELYNNKYSFLFGSQENEDPSVVAIFADIVLTAGNSLNEQTPESLAMSAKTIRSEAFASYASELEDRNAELRVKLDGIPATMAVHQARMAAHQAKLDEAEARRAEVANQLQTAVSNISIAKFTLNKQLQAIVEGTVDITNFSELAVTSIRYNLEIELPGISGHLFQSQQTLALPNPLQPDETLTDHPIDFNTIGVLAINEQPDVKRVNLNDFVGNLETANPKAEFVFYSTLDENGGVGRQSLVIPAQEQNYLRDFECRLEKCEKTKIKFTEAISANEAFIVTVKAAASDPKPVEGNFQRVTTFGHEC